MEERQAPQAVGASTLATYAYPIIDDLDVNDVDEAHLLKILEPIWTTKKETASRLRARIENRHRLRHRRQESKRRQSGSVVAAFENTAGAAA